MTKIVVTEAGYYGGKFLKAGASYEGGVEAAAQIEGAPPASPVTVAPKGDGPSGEQAPAAGEKPPEA